jgi:hypothetical protein
MQSYQEHGGKSLFKRLEEKRLEKLENEKLSILFISNLLNKLFCGVTGVLAFQYGWEVLNAESSPV